MSRGTILRFQSLNRVGRIFWSPSCRRHRRPLLIAGCAEPAQLGCQHRVALIAVESEQLVGALCMDARDAPGCSCAPSCWRPRRGSFCLSPSLPEPAQSPSLADKAPEERAFRVIIGKAASTWLWSLHSGMARPPAASRPTTPCSRADSTARPPHRRLRCSATRQRSPPIRRP